MDANREELLYRFLDELKSDCQTIIDMQNELEEAKRDEQRINEEQPQLDNLIKESKERQKNLELYREDIITFGKKHTNLIDDIDTLTFDFNIFAKEAKEAYDNEAGNIKEAEEKKQQNTIDLEKDTDIINFAPDNINNAIKLRDDLKKQIDKVVAGKIEYLDGSHIEPMLKKLDFDKEEIKKILPAICYPEEEIGSNRIRFKELYENYINDKNNGKSMGAVINEAMNNSKDVKQENDKITDIFNFNPVLSKTPEEEKTEKKEDSISTNQRDSIDEESLKKSFLNDVFAITEEDIEYNPEVMAIPTSVLRENLRKLNEVSINPQVIRTKTLTKNNVERLIKNVMVFQKTDYSLDDKSIAEHCGALDSTPTEKVLKTIKIVHDCGLTLSKPNGMIAVDVVTRDPNKLRKAIQLVAEIDITYFIQYPEKMDDKIADRMARILFCQQNGISYKNENNEFESFIESAEEWQKTEEIYGGKTNIDNSIIPKASICNASLTKELDVSTISALQKASILDNFLEKIEINDKIKEKYQQVTDILNDINESDNEVVITIGNHNFLTTSVYKNIVQVLNDNINESVENILLGSLLYNSHNNPEVIKDIKYKVDPNTRGLK